MYFGGGDYRRVSNKNSEERAGIETLLMYIEYEYCTAFGAMYMRFVRDKA